MNCGDVSCSICGTDRDEFEAMCHAAGILSYSRAARARLWAHTHRTGLGVVAIVLALVAAVTVTLLVAGGAYASPARPAAGVLEPGSDYTGPFVMAKVPAVCVTSTAGTRYYTTAPPDSSAFFRSGEHGHGNRIACIYFSSRAAGGPVLYGKWLVFDGKQGWLIAPNGNEVSYVDCAYPGMVFPPPPFTGANDCAESWVPNESTPYVYETGPATGQTMHPAVLP